jgi:hypothetical protein
MNLRALVCAVDEFGVRFEPLWQHEWLAGLYSGPLRCDG